MLDTDLSPLQIAIQQYLGTISAVGKCLAEACPPIGGPYEHKFARIRARLAFDCNPAALEESATVLADDLHRYSAQAAGFLAHHASEVSKASRSLETLTERMVLRQEFYAGRLRQFAGHLDNARYSDDPVHWRDVVALEAASLDTCVESMSHEMQSLMADLLHEIRAIEQRVGAHETTDLLTGLTNRRELERQIEERMSLGEPVILIHFAMPPGLGDEVVQQVAMRLCTQFRPADVVARWTPAEFVVLFQGTVEIAELRSSQVVPWVGGRYPRAKGDTVDVEVKARVTDAVGMLVG